MIGPIERLLPQASLVRALWVKNRFIVRRVQHQQQFLVYFRHYFSRGTFCTIRGET